MQRSSVFSADSVTLIIFLFLNHVFSSCSYLFSFFHQVALNQAYNNTLNSASDVLSETMKEQASLMDDVRSAHFICVDSTEQIMSSIIVAFFAALHSQEASAENCPHAPAAEWEGSRRSERTRRVHVCKGSGCWRQRTGPRSSWNCEVIAAV